MAENRPAEILEILQKTFTVPKWVIQDRNSFKTLVVTIISQNTTDRNTTRAFENLSKRFEINPEVLANADTSQIEQCLKVVGLYKNKAKAIKQVSKTILQEFHGNLESILSLPLEQARETLLKLAGVGPKTADVVLLFSAHRSTVPVDTHVNRVGKRLGLAPMSGGYEAVRESLQSLYEPKDYLAVHLLLISHGRKHCRARNPLCKHCPVNKLCQSRQFGDRND
jgi:endonuclease-3